MKTLIGVLPAAGRGSRLGAIPSSKEILPLGFQPSADSRLGWSPLTAIESHLAGFKAAGIERVVIVLGPGKYDIMEYLGGGQRFGMDLSYVFQETLRGMPFALDLARSWTRDAEVAFAMPDTIVEPRNSVANLARAHHATGADLSLGLFQTDNPAKFGMVELDAEGEVLGFVDKPKVTDLKWMWGMAVWSSAFSAFMSETLAAIPPGGNEVVLSDVFDSARRNGLRISGVPLNGSKYNDIGTPEEFQRVVQSLADRVRSPNAADRAADQPKVTTSGKGSAGRLSVVQRRR